MNRELFWIWLSLGLTPGSRSCKRILERFRTPEEFFRAPDDQWRSFRLPAGELSALSTRDLVQAEKISAACREKGIDLIAPGDQAYPNRLWEIPNPPALLYCQGVLPDLEEALCLAAVGTRSATEDGTEIRLRALLQAGRSRYRDRQRRGFGRGSSRFGRRLAGKGKNHRGSGRRRGCGLSA